MADICAIDNIEQRSRPCLRRLSLRATMGSRNRSKDALVSQEGNFEVIDRVLTSTCTDDSGTPGNNLTETPVNDHTSLSDASEDSIDAALDRVQSEANSRAGKTVVSFKDDDPENPVNWSTVSRGLVDHSTQWESLT